MKRCGVAWIMDVSRETRAVKEARSFFGGRGRRIVFHVEQNG